jgi:hypothetical protein
MLAIVLITVVLPAGNTIMPESPGSRKSRPLWILAEMLM